MAHPPHPIDRRSAGKLLLATLVPMALPALAQAYPSKPIRMLVGYPPGGGADIMARLLALALAERLGQAVVVDNRAGAAGGIACELTAHASPDGYTVLLADRGMLVFNMGLFKKLSYSPDKDLAAVGTVLRSHFVLVGRPMAGRENVQALLAQARATPGKLNYAATATGSTAAMELFKQRAGVDIVSIPYKGMAPALTALLAGEVEMAMADVLSALPHIRSGKLLAYAVTSKGRLSWLPQTPTLDESGLAGYEAMTWLGLVTPAGTPQDVVARLNAALQQTVRNADYAQKLATSGLEPMAGSAEQMATLMKEEQAVWPDRLRQWGMAVE